MLVIPHRLHSNDCVRKFYVFIIKDFPLFHKFIILTNISTIKLTSSENYSFMEVIYRLSSQLLLDAKNGIQWPSMESLIFWRVNWKSSISLPKDSSFFVLQFDFDQPQVSECSKCYIYLPQITAAEKINGKHFSEFFWRGG